MYPGYDGVLTRPRDIERFDEHIDQLGVGKAGKMGTIQMTLESKSGKTILSKQFTQAPLQVQRVLYLEPSLPNLAFVYLLSTSGGILQGDRYTSEIILNNAAMAHITTQGATRIYGMNRDSATHITKLNVNAGCYLEYMPEQIIPYANSRYYQMTDATVHDTATLIYSEILTSGRTAMNESFAYDLCNLRFRYQNQDGIIRAYDNTKIEPAKQDIRGLGMMSTNQSLGTLVVINKQHNMQRLRDIISHNMSQIESISFGVSMLADDAGVVIRMLGTTDDLITAKDDTLGTCRRHILGVHI